MDVRVVKEGNQAVFSLTGFLGKDRFNTFRDCIAGSKYDAPTKSNKMPLALAIDAMGKLKASGFSVGMHPELAAALQAQLAEVKTEIAAADGRAEKVDAVLTARGLHLFPFQRVGIQWLASRHSALIADEMGLGKTVQMLSAIPENRPVLVVCPAVAKGVWKREAEKWRPELKVEVLSGRGSFRYPAQGEMICINFDILPKDLPEGCPEGLVLVADEAHMLKGGAKTQRGSRFRALSAETRKKSGRVFLLTATPLLNRPPELWSILSSAGLEKECFGSWPAFVEMFRGVPGQWGGFEWGVPDSARVKNSLQKVMLRRLKSEVLKDLPPKRWQTIPAELDSKTRKNIDALLKKAAENGIDILQALKTSDTSGLPSFEELAAVRAALATAKIPSMMAVVEEFEEQDEPLVVFSAHRAAIDLLGTRPGWATITGDTPPAKRSEIEMDFQAGKLKGIGATIKAGGVAITLTRASNVLFVDRDWTPALNSQAEDRCHRIGTVDSVLIKILVADHPVDERLAELLAVKKNIIDHSVEKASRRASERPETILDKAGSLGGLPQTPIVPSARTAPGTPYINGVAKLTNGGPQPPKTRRPPQSKAEFWAVAALRSLSNSDEDMAQVQNGVGFNKFDGTIGHSLAQQMEKGLTEAQWALAIKIASHYPKQVGPKPAE